MSFIELSLNARGYLLAFMMLSYLILLVCFLWNLLIKKNLSRIIVLGILVFLTIIVLAVLMELNRYAIDPAKMQLSLLGTYLAKTHVAVYVAIPSVMTLFVILITAYVYKDHFSKLGNLSVKAAIENLPTGILITTEKDYLVLSNQVINKLAITLTGHQIYDKSNFWGVIIDKAVDYLQGQNENVYSVLINENEMWQFSRRTITVSGENYIEILATNVSDIHKYSDSIHKTNIKLKKQHHKLEEINKNIERNVLEETTANIKTRFHDDLGSILTLTKKSLKESDNEKDIDLSIQSWERYADNIITFIQSERSYLNSLEELIKFANRLGCELKLEGQLPNNPESSRIMVLAISETLKNAVIHSSAKELKVKLQECDDYYRLSLENELTEGDKLIVEGGGLSNLRKKVSRVNGSMEIISDKNLVLTIKLPKELESEGN